MSNRRKKQKQIDTRPRADRTLAVSNIRAAQMNSWAKYLAIAQWGVFGLVCLLVAVLHVLLFQHSGAFWRDECSSILLSQAPSWPEMWEGLASDSFPALFVSVLRVWNQAGLGASDTGIRLLGILISIAAMVSVVLSCRAMQVKIPVLALVLVGLNMAVFYTASSIRAYGLALLLIVACFAAFWRVVQQPTRWNCAIAFVLAVLSIHANYQSSCLLLGIGVAAAAVAALNRRFIRSLLLLAIGFVAALTMLVYLPTIASYRGESIVLRCQVSTAQIGTTLLQAMSEGNLFVLAAWILLAAGPLALLLARRARAARQPDHFAGPAPQLYCLLTVIISACAGAVFFQANGMAPYVWHFVPFIALCAVAVECGLQSERYSQWISWAKIVAAVILAAVCFPNDWDAAQLRRTNMDKIAAFLESEARPGDTILVDCYLQPSFQKYYQGPVFWRIAPIDPSDTHTSWRSQWSAKEIMARPDSIRPTLEQVQATLSQGGRVWIVGCVALLPPHVALPALIPAPHPMFGWSLDAYRQIWYTRLGNFLQQHATHSKVPIEREKQGVWYLENRSLISFEGWRD